MVAGQVAAKEAAHYNGLHGKRIKEMDLAKEVVPLPENIFGKMLGVGTDLVPVEEAGQVIKITITAAESEKKISLKTNRLLYDSEGQPLAGGVHVKMVHKLLGKNRLVLYDKDEKPICLAIQDTKEVIHKAYYIYGTTPLHEEDLHKEKEGGIQFYRWLRVSDAEPENQIPFRRAMVWNGHKFVPLVMIREAQKEKKKGIEKVLDIPVAGDNVIVDAKNDSKVFGFVLKKGKKKTDGWNLVIAPGVDPVLVIMIATILDEMVEF